jgi:protoporphyrinogen/coproporphyrinogen III oxidase
VNEVTSHLVDPLIGGIHAGDTAVMSAAAVFPALLEAATRRGSLMRALRPVTSLPATAGDDPVFHSVRGGLSRLVDALGAALVERGVELRLQTSVDRLERRGAAGDHGASGEPAGGRWALHTPQGSLEADGVVIATPAPGAAALLEPVEPAVASVLATIDYADVTLVTMRFRPDDIGRTLDGTGFLVPAGAGCLITACTWLTSKWPELRRPGDVLLRASLGRYGDDRPSRLSDAEIVDRVRRDLEPMVGLRSEPMETVVTRWPEAFPQYTLGHVDRVASIERAVARLPSVALAGAAYHGVGIPACIASGRRAAAAVLEHPLTAGLPTR